MKIVTSLGRFGSSTASPQEARATRSDKPCVVSIGFFDGVHRGHQAILQMGRRTADRLNGIVRIITFEEHPSRFFRPEVAFQYLTTVEEKLEILERVGVDVVHLISFDAAVANTEAREFCEKELVENLNMRALVVGHDFAMGKNRAGTVSVLAQMGKELGFEAILVGAVPCNDDHPISSTRIRQLVIAGEVSKAAELMGHEYTLAGSLVRGRGLGRQIGFPTLNLQWHPLKLLPATGVYVTVAVIANERFGSVTNVGYRPTVDGKSLTVEAHLLTSDLPPALAPRDSEASVAETTPVITLHFIDRLREERKFSSLTALATQIRRDITAARERLNERGPSAL